MRFEVKKGTVKHDGVFYPKGSIFDAEKKDVETLLSSTSIIAVNMEQVDTEPARINQEMTIEELKGFLENAEFEKVKSLLEHEQGKSEPRKTAIKLLEEWLQNAENGDDVGLPELNADDVIVDGEVE